VAGGSLQLYEYPGDLVRLSCEKCGRAGQYQKRNLVERYGADILLPDLRVEIAKRATGKDARHVRGALRRADRLNLKFFDCPRAPLPTHQQAS
jgi:hypothetical protein